MVHNSVKHQVARENTILVLTAHMVKLLHFIYYFRDLLST